MFLRSGVAALIAAGVAIGLPATAGAVSSPIQIGSFTTESHEVVLPSVAVDANGTAYAAWPDLGTNLVDYCVLPDGATSCEFSGTLSPVNEPGGSYTPSNFPPTLSGAGRTVDVAINGSTVSIIATVIGGSVATDDGLNTPTEEWLASDGTANFTLVNGGNGVAYPNPAWQAPPPYQTRFEPSYMTDEVTVPGSGELGQLDFSPDGPPSFEAFPDTSTPPVCSDQSNPACTFATLEPTVSANPVSNFSDLLERQIASATSGPNPGVLAEFATDQTTGPFACPNETGVYMYGSGLESPTNDYNISPGQPDSAWKVPATLIPGDCPEPNELSVGGGPSGLGLLEASFGGGSSMKYLPIDPATGAFDQPAVTVDPSATASTPDIAQDGAGNLYATGFVYQASSGSSGGAPLALYYSGDGGKTWQGPGALETTVQPGFSRQQIAMGADGKGWMIITANPTNGGTQGSVYALEFTAADAGNALGANVQTATPPAVSSNGSVTVGLSCFTVPCTINAQLLQNAAGASSRGRVRAHALGSGSVQITQHGVHAITIPLSSAAQSALDSSGGHLATTFSASTAIGPYSQQNTTPLTITGKTTTTAPVISKLKRSKATLRYHDSVAGATRFVIYMRKHHRWVKVDTIVHHDKAGANVVHIKKHLAKGSYRITATPYLAGKAGKTLTVKFRVH
jgi:hypothetical protein